MRPIRNSAKAIIVENDCLLAITQQDPDGLYYILPGGGQEPGETTPQGGATRMLGGAWCGGRARRIALRARIHRAEP